MTKRYATRDARKAIAKREEFITHGAMSGKRVRSLGTGLLPNSERDKFEAAVKHATNYGTGVYVVFSYSTPIAWENADGTLYVPEVKYSVTTSRHQSHCRVAASM